MSKALVYAGNTATQTLAVGNVVNFGNVIRRFGCGCNISGGNLAVKGSGYYNVDYNATLVGTGAGIATLTWYKDGAPITGASVSVTTANGATYNVSQEFTLRECGCPCNNSSTLTCVLSGVDVNVTNATAVMTKE